MFAKCDPGNYDGSNIVSLKGTQFVRSGPQASHRVKVKAQVSFNVLTLPIRCLWVCKLDGKATAEEGIPSRKGGRSSNPS